MIDAPTLEEFRAQARQWLADNARPKDAGGKRWGEGSDGVAVFHDLATCIGSIGPLPASNGATKFVVTNAMLVPIMRPPTLVAKLPPVPRRWSGKTFGRYSPK